MTNDKVANRIVDVLVDRLSHGSEAQKLAAAQAILKHIPASETKKALKRILRERAERNRA